MQWDFWSLNPESAHQVTYLMGDRGIPKTFRHMNGYGSHTYMWVNAAGEKHWVKYHFHSDQGVEGLTGEEATRIAGEDADHHRRDLYEAIERGEFPSWTLSVQVMPYEDARTYRFNPFDLTKIWPHARLPAHQGRHDDPEPEPGQLLRADRAGRVRAVGARAGHRLLPRQDAARAVFAYSDTHRYRIGPNYLQLPVNRPRVDVNTYTQDGPMAYEHRGDAPVYAPNSQGRGYADQVGAVEDGWEADGAMVRQAYTLRPDDDDFGQAGALVREVWNDEQREQFVETVAGHLLGGVKAPVLERAFDYWKNVDADTGKRIEELVRSGHGGENPGGEADRARVVNEPIVETHTHARS